MLDKLLHRRDLASHTQQVWTVEHEVISGLPGNTLEQNCDLSTLFFALTDDVQPADQTIAEVSSLR